MPKIIPLKFQEVCKKLKKLWYEWPIPGWRHMHMYKWFKVVPVPKHWWKDISQWVIKSIINQIWLSVEEWDKL